MMVQFGGRRYGRTQAMVDAAPDTAKCLIITTDEQNKRRIGQALWRAKKPRVHVKTVDELRGGAYTVVAIDEEKP